MKLGLFGDPVSHSKSPVLFAALGKALGREIEYEAVRVDGDFGAAVRAAAARGWSGANVTIPFKLEAAKLADGLTAEARGVGAVNVLRFGETTTGHNTDADGLRDALHDAGIAVAGKSVLILGAGGAARAAGWACGEEKAKSVRFVNRTAATADRLAQTLGAAFPATVWSAGDPAAAQVWINATPTGEAGGNGTPEAAIDLVYGRTTPFLEAAVAKGAVTADGTAMLVFQALRAWEYWDAPIGAERTNIARRLIQEIS